MSEMICKRLSLFLALFKGINVSEMSLVSRNTGKKSSRFSWFSRPAASIASGVRVVAMAFSVCTILWNSTKTVDKLSWCHGVLTIAVPESASVFGRRPRCTLVQQNIAEKSYTAAERYPTAM